MAIPNIREIVETDHEIFDFHVNVVVTQPDGTSFEVSHALRFNLGTAWGGVGDAELPGGTVMFALWVEQCPAKPKLSATLRDLGEGKDYKVLRVDDVAAFTRYDVVCVPKVIPTPG